MVGHPLVFWSRCSHVDIQYRILTARPYTIWVVPENIDGKKHLSIQSAAVFS